MVAEHLKRPPIAEFYHFALLLTGHEAAARELLEKTWRGARGRVCELRRPEDRDACFARQLRRRCQELFPDGAGKTVDASWPDALRAVAELPEEERMAYALLTMDRFTAVDSARIMDLSLEEFAAVMGRARSLLPRTALETATL